MPCSYFWGRPSENFQKPNFVELRKAEVRRIPLLRTQVNKSLELTPSVPTEQVAPPSLRGGDLLQVPRPEQPILAVGQAHLYSSMYPSPP